VRCQPRRNYPDSSSNGATHVCALLRDPDTSFAPRWARLENTDFGGPKWVGRSLTLARCRSEFEGPHTTQAQLEWHPAQGKGQGGEGSHATHGAPEGDGFGPRPRRGESQQNHGAENVEEAQDQAKGPAETADDLARIL